MKTMSNPNEFGSKVVSPSGITNDQLSEAFDKVADPADWKNPIYAMCSGEGVKIVMEAIQYFTGTDPVIRLDINTMQYHIESVGYRMGPSGDH